ncbi:MAG: MFS transporter, partial [Gammaproteobacteria bacterium]
MARFFRPTVLEVFNLSNTELGDIFAVYGIIAMLSYFPGGAIADRFPAKKLIALSLWTTALGGLYFAKIPDQNGLIMLFAYWGCTSILLFWAALIRATREWGGSFSQGRAFGFVDGGRGLIAAGAASLIVIIFTIALPANSELASEIQLKHALQLVIYAYTAITFLAGFIVWWFIPNDHNNHNANQRHSITDMKYVLGKPAIWLQAIIVICAYCAYKGLDNYA